MQVRTDWQTLRTCVVGRTYEPDFYDWVTVPHARRLLAEMSQRTVEFLDQLEVTLTELDVEVVRPVIPHDISPNTHGNWPLPPLQPRNVMTLIDDCLSYCDPDWHTYYSAVRDPAWAEYASLADFLQSAPAVQIQELRQGFDLDREQSRLGLFQNTYAPVLDLAAQRGVTMVNRPWVDGGQVCRAGDWLVVGTDDAGGSYAPWQQWFGSQRVRVADTRGHVDGVFCVLREGLVVAHDDPNCVLPYHELFPGWEIIRVANHNLLQIKRQQADMAEFFRRSQGHWWIPDIEHDAEAVDFVQRRFDHWTGNASETILDVNMLVVNDRHVVMCGANQDLAEQLDRRGMIPIVMPVPYPWFWDGGIHCMTAELHRG